ncbi:hypothetical protein Y956_01764, partial [Nipponia nippon]
KVTRSSGKTGEWSLTSCTATSTRKNCRGFASRSSKGSVQVADCPHSSSRSSLSATTRRPVPRSKRKCCRPSSEARRARRAASCAGASPASSATLATTEPLSASSATE